MGRPRPPRGEHVATSRANALRFVCERVDKLFPASKYDIRDCGDIIELARSPTSSLTSSTAIVHFRPVLETVPVGPISKLASYKTSLGCPAVFVSWLQDYSDDAIAVAESNEILLYRLEPDGSWIPQNKAAEDHDKKNSLDAPPLIAWLSVVLVLTAIGALYFGPLILFSAEKLLRKALGFSGYIETVAVIGAVCLGVLFSLIWGQASGRAWRWLASAARSVIAFGVLVVNIVIIFACVYLARSEQYPGSFFLSSEDAHASTIFLLYNPSHGWVR